MQTRRAGGGRDRDVAEVGGEGATAAPTLSAAMRTVRLVPFSTGARPATGRAGRQCARDGIGASNEGLQCGNPLLLNENEVVESAGLGGGVQMKQLTFGQRPRRDGKPRKHPGRKPGSGRGVPHAKRPRHSRWNPIHITLRAAHGLPSFRQQIL